MKRAICFLLAGFLSVIALAGCGAGQSDGEGRGQELAQIEIYTSDKTLINTVTDEDLLKRFNTIGYTDIADNVDFGQTGTERDTENLTPLYTIVSYKTPAAVYNDSTLEKLTEITIYEDSNIVREQVDAESIKGNHIPEEYLTFYSMVSDEDRNFLLSLAVSDVSEEEAKETEPMKQEGEETAVKDGKLKDSFRVKYQGQEADNEIELCHCECVYDKGEVQIYAKYLYWLSVPETFPCDQYVLYIRTAGEELQLYPVKDFLVDEEHGILYTKIEGDNGFEKMKSLSFLEKDNPMLSSEREIFDVKQAEDMLCSAYGEAAENERGEESSLFSNITVDLEEVNADNTGSLTGYISGIEGATGQRYYADWKLDVAEGDLTSKLCVLEEYDKVKDQEEFAACSRIFDQIEQGDWRDVKPLKEEDSYLWGMEEEEWIRMDVNGDEMPELVGCWGTVGKKIVSVIFAYQDHMAEMIYVDVNDGMEYLFITGKGELVYEWGVSGGPCTNIFRRCTFDLKWKREYTDTLVRYRFTEADEDDAEYYREFYPDTYGVGGSGTYYLRERRKTEEELKHNEDGKYTVREYLTEEAFLKMYEDWTGWDFYESTVIY